MNIFKTSKRTWFYFLLVYSLMYLLACHVYIINTNLFCQFWLNPSRRILIYLIATNASIFDFHCFFFQAFYSRSDHERYVFMLIWWYITLLVSSIFSENHFFCYFFNGIQISMETIWFITLTSVGKIKHGHSNKSNIFVL